MGMDDQTTCRDCESDATIERDGDLAWVLCGHCGSEHELEQDAPPES